MENDKKTTICPFCLEDREKYENRQELIKVLERIATALERQQ